MRVLIVGAGIAGPTLAWFLSKSGRDTVTVLEKSSHFLNKGHNVDINGSALKVLEKMDLLDALLDRHTSEKGAYVVDSNGRPFAQFPVIPGKDASPTSEHEIMRGDLAELLYESSKDLPGVEYLFGTTILRILSTPEAKNAPVTIHLSNGDVRDFDLVVAADGQWSKTRTECFPADVVTVIDKDLFMVYSTIPRQPEDNDWVNIYLASKSRNLFLRPDNHGTIRAALTKYCADDNEKAQWRQASRSDRETQMRLVRATFSDAGWCTDRILQGMESTDEFYFQEVRQIRMRKWSNGRIVCVGDAACAPTPITGKGTSLALVGAYTLAGELSLLEEGEHPARALDGYEAMLRPFVEKIQDIPSYVPRMMHPNGKLEVGLMKGVLWKMSKVMATSLYAKLFLKDATSEDEDFPLPIYAF
ncbi:hypothetical protein BJ742DRAFT_740311 [Cladochytrium replicatum]|nr:hypothetical protein BJ742DRAFT_740311 [Cladochytrium replicatum]